SDRELASLLHDFVAQQHANVFTRAFSFPASQLPLPLPLSLSLPLPSPLPVSAEKGIELADRVLLLDNIGFIFQLRERKPKVASKAGDLEKWVANYVVRKGTKQIQNTRDLLGGYMALSVVNHFGHRITVSPKNPDTFVSMIIYRVPPKSRAFRAGRFKKNRTGGFVHILRDADYFEICHHFVTPAELFDYFSF